MLVHPISDIRVGPRHRKDLGDLAPLAASIAEVGLLHPVVVRPDRTLISGERRLRAAELLGWTDVPIHVVDGLEETLRALQAEIDENVCREDFLITESVAVGEEIERPFSDEAKANQRRRKGKQPGTDNSGNLPDLSPIEVRDKVAAVLGMSGRTYERAKAVVAAAAAEPEKFGPLAQDMDRTGKVNGSYKRLCTARAAESIRAEPPPLPDGPFRVIVVDPPWQYDKRAEDPSHRAIPPYPCMSLEDIRRLDVAGRAHADCVLWLWTTNAHIPHAFSIVEGWGFQYKTMLTWVKDRMGTGEWLRGRTEHCLMAIRGRPTVTLRDQTTAIDGPLRDHSRKPEAFYSLVESLCPGSRLEMFARTPREGWSAYGNEVR
jgi:ParB/RepB/Spo0J family partition protein